MTACKRAVLVVVSFLLLIIAEVVSAQTEIVLSPGMSSIKEDGQIAHGIVYPLVGRSEAMQRFRIVSVTQFIKDMPQARALRLELVGAFFYGGGETIDVFSVDGRPTISPAYFDDLGTGTLFGSAAVSFHAGWRAVTIELNEDAVAAFNRAPRSSCYTDEEGTWCQPGFFRFALSIREPFSSASGTDGVSFEGTGHRLIVTPVALAVEPTTWGRVKALYRN